MNPLSELQPVILSDIDTEDRSYSLIPWNDSPDEKLLYSIKRFGILHPPVLKRKKNDAYCIVTGRKRISAAQHYAPDSAINCYVIQTNTTEKDILSLLIEEKTISGPITITEQVIFFEKLLQVSSPEESIPFLQKLGYKPHEHILHDLLKLRSLDLSVLQAMHRGIIQRKNARKLLKLSKDDQRILVQIIAEFHLGGSKQQNMIELCTELVKRRKLPLETILADIQSSKNYKQPDNKPQHTAELLAWLQKESFPLSSNAEKAFQQRLARLNLPSTMRVSHTTAFENEEITLSLRFANWKAFEKIQEDIRNIMHGK